MITVLEASTVRHTIIPNTRFAVATIAFPVPRSLVGNNSGETAYSTPYITLLVKVYPQFHPRSASEVRAVVPAKRKTPVKTTRDYRVSLGHGSKQDKDRLVEIANVPLRPRSGNSTNHPARRAPGTPITLQMPC